MTIKEIIEFQKKSAEVLAEMISELDESELKKILSPAKHNDQIAVIHIDVSKFRGITNGMLGTVSLGCYDSEIKATFTKHNFDCLNDKNWKLDEVLSRGAECLRG